MSAAAQEHPFLTARHVDDLTDAVRGLTHQLVEAGRQHQTQLDISRRQLEVLASIRDALGDIRASTDALRDVIVRQRTNGSAEANIEAKP
jgi:hypothetical protein